MRNLKKLLSVVLVVAMIASLCAVGSFSAAAAEYSEVTNYDEAAAVITGVGVMDGYEDGTMQYDKAVTREEAAAIICRALIGVDTAKKLTTAVAPFSDVAANRWSAPYINYLKAQGIVNGKSATQFDPTAEVTGVEFAKMMLCAVGYGKAGEFVGASWDVNTITAANNNGVYTGTLATDLTAPATREQCMLYTFNTMTRIPVVSYNTAFQSYYVGTSVVSGIDSRVADVNIGVKNTNYDYTLAYRNFKLERQNAGVDDYGRTAVKWTADGKAVVEEVSKVAPDYTLYGSVNSDVLYKNLGKAVVKDINDNYARFTVYTNGVGPTTPIAADIKSGDTMVNSISGAGDTVELYVTEANGIYSVKAVVIKQYFAQVTKIDTSANKLYATVIDGANDYTNCVADGDDVNINGLKKDDYILVNVHKNGGPLANGSVITSIATPKTAVATYNGTTFMGIALDFDGNMTFANNTIDTALITAALPIGVPAGFTIGYQYTCYYDSLGNIIYAKFYDEGNATGTTSYLYVVSAEADNGSSILSSTTATLALDVVYPNGGEEVVKVLVSKDTTGKYATITTGTTTDKYYFDDTVGGNGKLYKNATSGTNAIGDFAGKFFSFSKSADGFVKLSAPNANYATADNAGGAYDTVPGKTSIVGIAGFTATSSTVLTVVDKNGNVSTYTGYANFPKNLQSSATNYKALYTYASNSTKLKTICLYNTTGLVAAESNLALCGGFWSHNATGDIAIFYVDGEYKMVTFDTNNSGLYVSNTVYELTLSDSGNTATPVTDYYYPADGALKTGVVNASQGTFGGYSTATNLKGNATAYLGLGHVNFGTFAIDEYYAWALVDDVDGNVFTTKAVKTADIDSAIYPTMTAGVDKIDASTYYFNSNTKIYDCRNNTCTKLSELPTNVAFIAYINEDLYTNVNGVAYCEYIWIVG